MRRCLCTAVLVLLAVPAAAAVIDRVVAVVGTEIITLSDVRAVETFGLGPAQAGATPAAATTYLVNRRLMLGEVDRYAAPGADPGMVDRRLAEIRSRFKTTADFAAALARTAMTEGRLRSIVGDDLRIAAYLDQMFSAAAQPAADEVLRYYQDHPDEFTRGGRLTPFEDIQAEVQARVAAERRRAMVADWLDRLRRRANVLTPLVPTSPPAR
jgi:hypothetical protein